MYNYTTVCCVFRRPKEGSVELLIQKKSTEAAVKCLAIRKLFCSMAGEFVCVFIFQFSLLCANHSIVAFNHRTYSEKAKTEAFC